MFNSIDIYIFIPVSGCVDRAPVHCFDQPIMLLRRSCVQHHDLSLLLNLAHLNEQCAPYSGLLSGHCVQRTCLAYIHYSALSSDQCVPWTCKPLHIIRVYPVTSAYRGFSKPYTVFRCTQWPVRTEDLLTFTPYSGVPSDQCVPRTY